MKQLLDLLTGDQNQSNISDIAEKFGLDTSQVSSAVSALLPSVSQGIQKQVQSENSSILDSISDGGLQQFLDDDNVKLTDDSAVESGQNLLGQLFDSGDDMKSALSGAAEKTGLDSSILEQIMPMVSSMALGGIGKQFSGLSSLGESGQGGIMGMVSSMIDTDGDGIDLGDIKNIAGKFFG